MAAVGDRTEWIVSNEVLAANPIPIDLIPGGLVSPLDVLSGIGDGVQGRFVAEAKNDTQDWMIFLGTPDAGSNTVSRDTLIKSTTGAWLDLPAGSRVYSDRDAGVPGPAGEGVPVGGSAGQVLAKASATDFATQWEDRARSQERVLGNLDHLLAWDTFRRPDRSGWGVSDSGHQWTNVSAFGDASIDNNMASREVGANGGFGILPNLGTDAVRMSVDFVMDTPDDSNNFVAFILYYIDSNTYFRARFGGGRYKLEVIFGGGVAGTLADVSVGQNVFRDMVSTLNIEATMANGGDQSLRFWLRGDSSVASGTVSGGSIFNTGIFGIHTRVNHMRNFAVWDNRDKI